MASLYLGKYRTLYVQLCLGDEAIFDLSTEKKFHMQKCDGLENIEKPSPTLEVTLGSSTNINLEHNRIKIQKRVCRYGANLGISNRIFLVSSRPLIDILKHHL